MDRVSGFDPDGVGSNPTKCYKTFEFYLLIEFRKKPPSSNG